MAMVSRSGDDDMLTVVGHPLIEHRLSQMREISCPVPTFRALLRDIAMLLGATALADLPLEKREIETPLESMAAPKLAGKPPIFAPVLRAGIGFLDGLLTLLPEAGVAHIGVYRDHKTLQAHEYYFRAPEDLAERLVILLDPMLATGNSAVAALDRLKARERHVFASSVCSPRPRVSGMCGKPIPMSRSGPPRLTKGWMKTAISAPALVMRGTGFLARETEPLRYRAS